MNREAKDVPTKQWCRISSGSPAVRRLSCEVDMINIKLRKMAFDVLEWNTEEVRFAIGCSLPSPTNLPANPSLTIPLALSVDQSFPLTKFNRIYFHVSCGFVVQGTPRC